MLIRYYNNFNISKRDQTWPTKNRGLKSQQKKINGVEVESKTVLFLAIFCEPFFVTDLAFKALVESEPPKTENQIRLISFN